MPKKRDNKTEPIEIKYPKYYKDLSIYDLKKKVLEKFDKKFKNKVVKNKDTGANILLTKKGIKHAMFARKSGFVKIILTLKIAQIVRTAKFDTQTKSRKKEYLFFICYKNKIRVDDKEHEVFIYVGVKPGKDLQLYYDHILIE